MTDIDTQIRHVTKPEANLFSQLGFAPCDAQCYERESREQISQTLALKGLRTSKESDSGDPEADTRLKSLEDCRPK